MKKMTLMVLLAAGVGQSASGQITLTEIGRLDLSTVFNSSGLGSNISSVAWDGTDVYVGGFDNGSPANTTVGIVRVADALGAATQTSFAVLTTPDSRGYTGLAIQNGQLAAAYDDNAADPNGIALYNGATGAQVWAQNARGGSGVDFDPGFNGAGAGVAWTTFGSGRRALNDTATGAPIFTTANGAIINVGTGTFWRDIAFNPDTGDIYARRSNGLIIGTRNGDNSFTGLTAAIAPVTSADFVAGHNVEVVAGSDLGSFVILNNRPNGNAGQDVLNVLTVVGLDGSALTLTLDTLSPILSGNGYYDFSYDAASQTLAVSDFANNQVYIFAVPAPGVAGVLGVAGLLASRRRR